LHDKKYATLNSEIYLVISLSTLKLLSIPREEFMDDQKYIEMILQGNREAFSDLVNKHKDMVYTLALRIVKNAEDAEEIAQDAFVKVYKALPGFKGNAKFTTWLFKIVYNTAISKARKARNSNLYLEDISEQTNSIDSDLDILSNLDREEAKDILHGFLEKLPVEERTIITLYYLNENTVEEIAQITGLSKSNVKVKLFRSRNKLRSLIQNMTTNSFVNNIRI
jgi:RNA polymerase sigma-70 factor (ECF subfamily)